MTTALLLLVSNIFMTIAWYGHLRFKSTPLGVVILVSWLIAGVEYCFAIPANRIGHVQGFSTAQLKIMQEVITLVVFAIFSVVYMREKMTWNYYAAFVLLLGAVWLVFAVKPSPPQAGGEAEVRAPEGSRS